MSKDFKFELNSAGVSELLNCSEIKNVCMEYAENVRNTCGDGYEVQEYSGKYRSGARVHAATPHAYYSNLKHNTLLKALGGGK